MKTPPGHPIRFSQRTAWNRSPSELQQEFSRSGKELPLLDLTTSNPTACGFVLLAPDFFDPVQDPRWLLYEPDPRGLHSAREAIAQYYAGHSAIVSPDQILLTASTSEAYSHLFRLLCEPGDEVLMAQPSYPLLDYLADVSDVMLRFYPLFYDHGWWIDIAELERAISPRTRAIVIVHPNNPTGNPTSSSERRQLYDLCRRYGLTLIVDEVFLDYAHRGSPKLQSFAASDDPPLTFVLNGMSKIAALPQVKLGWILSLGPDHERLEAMTRLEFLADIFLSVNTPSQMALPGWFANAPYIQQQILNRISSNCRLLSEAKLDVYEVSAGWSAIVRIPPMYHHGTAFETLRSLSILTHPAHFYGLGDPNRVVLSLITPTEIMHSALERISRLLQEVLPADR